jgi:hypothetical protein
MMGGGVEVIVRGGQLKARLLTPIPAAYRGIQLHADDETDPYVFRIDLSQFGMGTTRVVFSRADGTGRTTAVHIDMGLLSFQKRPHQRNPGRWLARAMPALLVSATAVATRRRSSGATGTTASRAQGKR